jgi:hypothetical protein
MNIGSSSGLQAATQLMQATNQVVSLATQQLQVTGNKVSEVKSSALQNSAQQMSAAVQRKGNIIDVLA